jgi:transposase
LNQLQALRTTAPPALRERLQGRTGHQLTRHLLRQPTQPANPQETDLIDVLHRTASRIEYLTSEIDAIDARIAQITSELAPEMLTEHGIGPYCLSQIVVSTGDPRRLRKQDASLASLGGTCPIPTSSGQITRHRLNRGGDRQLNNALHTIALTRIRTTKRHAPTTNASKTTAKQNAKRSAASNAPSPDASTSS